MSEDTGTVFNIQKFCIHDGPGIRTTVFLKGCPLRCKWCHNPESNLAKSQLMYHEHLCTGCGNCVTLCPVNAINLSQKTGKSVTDFSKCIICGECIRDEVCEHGARSLAGRQETIADILKEVLKDKIFYNSSGGGVTISGGEPLMQAEFTSALLRTCKENGLSTAVETSGFASWENAEKVFQYTDLILFDIKQMDTESHKKYTGVDNLQILDNLRKAAKKLNSRIWLRLPLISGVNDSTEEIREVAALAKELGDRVEQVWLLAYHNLGVSKLEALGEKADVMNGFKAPSLDHMEKLKHILEEAGQYVVLG